MPSWMLAVGLLQSTRFSLFKEHLPTFEMGEWNRQKVKHTTDQEKRGWGRQMILHHAAQSRWWVFCSLWCSVQERSSSAAQWLGLCAGIRTRDRHTTGDRGESASLDHCGIHVKNRLSCLYDKLQLFEHRVNANILTNILKGVVLWAHSQMQTLHLGTCPEYHTIFSVHGALTSLAGLADCPTSKELMPVLLRIGSFVNT